MLKEVVEPTLRYYREGLRKIKKNHSEGYIRYSGRNSNRTPPEFITESLPLEAICLVIPCIICREDTGGVEV
jgi:hypothetical protein